MKKSYIILITSSLFLLGIFVLIQSEESESSNNIQQNIPTRPQITNVVNDTNSPVLLSTQQKALTKKTITKKSTRTKTQLSYEETMELERSNEINDIMADIQGDYNSLMNQAIKTYFVKRGVPFAPGSRISYIENVNRIVVSNTSFAHKKISDIINHVPSIDDNIESSQAETAERMETCFYIFYF